jgi:hypothetical protein
MGKNKRESLLVEVFRRNLTLDKIGFGPVSLQQQSNFLRTVQIFWCALQFFSARSTNIFLARSANI